MRYILILLIFLGSCVTQKGARNYYAKHTDKFSTDCSNRFPPQTYTRDSIVYLPGKIPEVREIRVDCDSIVRNTTTVVDRIVRLRIPPDVVHDTLLKVRETLQTNTAKEVSLQLQLEKEKKLATEKQVSLKWWRNTSIILMSVVILYLLGKYLLAKFNIFKRL